jgi:hypothetical protein
LYCRIVNIFFYYIQKKGYRLIMNKKDTVRKHPKIAVAVLVQRAADLFAVCRRDKSDLVKVGLQWETVEKMANLTPLCAIIEAKWVVSKEIKVAETARLLDYVRTCRKFRNMVVCSIRAAALEAGITIPLPRYRNSWAQAELVQDLNDLTVVCRNYRDILRETRFDMELEQKSAHLCKELADRLAKSTVLREQLADRITGRNEACRELYLLVLDICRIGKFAFPEDPRARDYHYNYSN